MATLRDEGSHAGGNNDVQNEVSESVDVMNTVLEADEGARDHHVPSTTTLRPAAAPSDIAEIAEAP